MMKTLLLTVAYNGRGGLERVVANMANSFVKNNFRVIVLSLAPTEFLFSAYPLAPEVERHYLFFPNFSSLSPIAAFVEKIKLFISTRRYFKQNKVDFAIDNDIYIPPFYFRINGVKTAVSYHSYFGYYRFSWRDIINKKGAHYNVILSGQEIDKWKKQLNHVVVIPNMLVPLPAPEKKIDGKFILAVGRLDKNKDFRRLIQSYLPLITQFPDWKLIIVGEGSERNSLQTFITEHHAEKFIELKPLEHHIENYYGSASIFALTSHYEGFPMVLVEAMSFGVPCVSFDITTGPKDMIDHQQNGFLIENNNLEAYTQALATLMKDEKLRIDMGEKARRIVSDRFSETVVINKWLSLINEQ